MLIFDTGSSSRLRHVWHKDLVEVRKWTAGWTKNTWLFLVGGNTFEIEVPFTFTIETSKKSFIRWSRHRLLWQDEQWSLTILYLFLPPGKVDGPPVGKTECSYGSRGIWKAADDHECRKILASVHQGWISYNDECWEILASVCQNCNLIHF